MSQSVWSYPVLPLAQYVVWPGCGFLDPGYFEATLKENGRGSVHAGTDLNGRGGGNTDLGAPIYAMCSGRVIHAQRHSVWGWIVVLDHPADGVQTQYAHFDSVYVKPGQPVRVGDQLGTIGRGGQNSKGRFYFLAHLHCEVRAVALPADEWPSNSMGRAQAESYIAKTRHDVMKWLESKGAAKTAEELRAQLERAAALDTMPVKVVPRPEAPAPAPQPGVPDPNWVQVLDFSSKQPIPGEWVSVWRDEAGKLIVYRVEPYKLTQRGLKA